MKRGAVDSSRIPAFAAFDSTELDSIRVPAAFGYQQIKPFAKALSHLARNCLLKLNSRI